MIRTVGESVYDNLPALLAFAMEAFNGGWKMRLHTHTHIYIYIIYCVLYCYAIVIVGGLDLFYRFKKLALQKIEINLTEKPTILEFAM